MYKQIIKVLCFDPGMGKTGWSLINYIVDNGNCVIEKHGLLKPNRITGHVAMREECERYGKDVMALCELELNVKELLETLTPDYVVSEDIFYFPGRPMAYVALSQWFTTVKLLCKRFYLPVFKVPTKIAKKEIFGSGCAGKNDVQDAILTNTRISFKTKPPKELDEHVADSIAVGIAFCNSILQSILLENESQR